jgi:methenyltetrahydromethanopterin cyclohydrolase
MDRTRISGNPLFALFYILYTLIIIPMFGARIKCGQTVCNVGDFFALRLGRARAIGLQSAKHFTAQQRPMRCQIIATTCNR